MPHFKPLTTERVTELTTRAAATHSYDPTEYVGYVTNAAQALDNGAKYGGGMFELEQDDNVRALKRRTTIASKTVPNVVLKWRPQKDETKLEFLVMRPESVVKRAKKAQEPEAKTEAPKTDTTKKSGGSKKKAA